MCLDQPQHHDAGEAQTRSLSVSIQDPLCSYIRSDLIRLYTFCHFNTRLDNSHQFIKWNHTNIKISMVGCYGVQTKSINMVIAVSTILNLKHTVYISFFQNSIPLFENNVNTDLVKLVDQDPH